MKLTFIDDYELAAITDEGAVSLAAATAGLEVLPPQQRINRVIEDWDEWRPKFEAAIAAGTAKPLGDIRLRARLPKPTALVCMAVNYMENGTLKEKPPQQAFFKNSHAVIGEGDTMHLPDAPASIFEGEAEMALVIGRKATRVPEEDAYSYVFGYLNFVDGSARGLPGGMGLPYFMKGQDDFAPLGPWITTADEIDNPMNLAVKQWVNGKVTHDYNTDDMAHNITASVHFVTSNTSLEAGDVIALGTNHGGLHPLQHGDVVEQEVEGLGRLTFNVHDDLERTWERATRAERGKDGPAPQLTGKYKP